MNGAEVDAPAPGRNILLALDESGASDKVFEYMLANVYRQGDTVHLLHVIPPSRRLVVTPDMGLEGVIEDDEETKRKVEAHAQEFVSAFERRLSVLKVPYQVDLVRGCVDNDSIGALVCRRAEQLEAVMLLMAKHNRGAIKEFFVGSCCSYCSRHCKQPVLIMHCD